MPPPYRRTDPWRGGFGSDLEARCSRDAARHRGPRPPSAIRTASATPVERAGGHPRPRRRAQRHRRARRPRRGTTARRRPGATPRAGGPQPCGARPGATRTVRAPSRLFRARLRLLVDHAPPAGATRCPRPPCHAGRGGGWDQRPRVGRRPPRTPGPPGPWSLRPDEAVRRRTRRRRRTRPGGVSRWRRCAARTPRPQGPPAWPARPRRSPSGRR